MTRLLKSIASRRGIGIALVMCAALLNSRLGFCGPGDNVKGQLWIDRGNLRERVPTPAAPPVDNAVFGVWKDDDGSLFTISKGSNGEPRLTAMVCRDGEVCTVEKSSWNDGCLTWTYYVPSTNYRVTFKTQRLTPDGWPATWSNDHAASGTTILKREPPAKPR